MREAFAKASHIFSTKNTGIFEILTFEIVTRNFNETLTTPLVLNNRALMLTVFCQRTAATEGLFWVNLKGNVNYFIADSV